MNKFTLLLIFSFGITSPLLAATVPCANGTGELVQGHDGATYYCRSNVRMNWWSAFAWCDSIGATLFDVNTECPKTSGTNPCPQIDHLGGDNDWTVNSIDNDTAVTAWGWAGNTTSSISSKAKTELSRAFCVMPSNFSP